MNDTISYKIQSAYMLPYEQAINEKVMDYYDKTNETIASSRIYFICKLKQKGVLFKKLSKPEVLYVGETFNKKSRFSPHKKLLQATTFLREKEILAVYFLHIRFSYIGVNKFKNKPLNIFNELKDIYSKTSVTLLERLFIKLFNPILNNKHNNKNVKTDNLVQKKLIDNFIHYVTLDVGMNEYIFNFVGGRRIENQDWYTFDLTNNKMIFGHPLIE